MFKVGWCGSLKQKKRSYIQTQFGVITTAYTHPFVVVHIAVACWCVVCTLAKIYIIMLFILYVRAACVFPIFTCAQFFEPTILSVVSFPSDTPTDKHTTQKFTRSTMCYPAHRRIFTFFSVLGPPHICLYFSCVKIIKRNKQKISHQKNMFAVR